MGVVLEITDLSNFSPTTQERHDFLSPLPLLFSLKQTNTTKTKFRLKAPGSIDDRVCSRIEFDDRYIMRWLSI